MKATVYYCRLSKEHREELHRTGWSGEFGHSLDNRWGVIYIKRVAT